MAFEGYEIPTSIGVSRMDLPVIEQISTPFGESPEQYMFGCFGLVAIWGELIDLERFRPGIIHGIANRDAGVVELFSIDDLIEASISKVAERKLIFKELGFNDTDEDTLTFMLPEILRPWIRNACVYFGHSPESLIAAATDIREVVLSSQNNGLIYTFSADGDNWREVELDTITGDPRDAGFLSEYDDFDDED